MYSIITDGAYSSSLKQGGCAFVILKDDKKILEFSKGFANTTNNRMEMMAIIAGLKTVKKPIESLTIITDSEYCIGCAIKGWKRKKNTKLWEVFDIEFTRVKELCPNIEFKHVKGHAGDYWNEYVDKLAVKASRHVLNLVNHIK